MSEVSELLTKLTLNDSEFKRKITENIAHVEKLSNGMKNMATVGVAAFAAVVGSALFLSKTIFDAADRVNDLYLASKKLGTSVESFQELSIAARESGVNVDSLQRLMQFMNKTIGNAELGNGKAADAFKKLGISLSDLDKLSSDQKLRLIAEQLSKITNLSQEHALAGTIFGRGGLQAVAFFNSNIEESVNRVKRLGITLTDSQAANLHKLEETKQLAGSVWQGFENNVSAELAPAFTRLFDGILKSVEGMGGLKHAAKSTADFIIDAMNGMVSAISKAVSMMGQAKAIYNDIATSSIGQQIAEANQKSADWTTSHFQAGLWDKQVSGIDRLLQHIMPNNSTLSDQALQSSRIIRSTVSSSGGSGENSSMLGANIVSKSSELANLSQQVSSVMQRSVSALGQLPSAATAASAAVNKVATSFNHALDNLFGIGGEGKAYIQSQLSKGPQQAVDPRFSDLLNQIKTELQTGDKKNIDNQIKSLSRISKDQNTIGDDGKGNFFDISNSDMLAAVKEIQKAAHLGETKPQQVTIKLDYDKEGLVKAYATSSKAQATTYQWIVAAAASEAQSSGY